MAKVFSEGITRQFHADSQKRRFRSVLPSGELRRYVKLEYENII